MLLPQKQNTEKSQLFSKFFKIFMAVYMVITDLEETVDFVIEQFQKNIYITISALHCENKRQIFDRIYYCTLQLLGNELNGLKFQDGKRLSKISKNECFN